MISLVIRRFAMMVLIMLTTTFLLFLAFETDKHFVAGKALGPYSSNTQRLLWLSRNGYDDPFLTRYLGWLGKIVTGHFGTSIQFNVPVAEIVFPSLLNTAVLAAWVFVLTAIVSMALGVLSGIAEGSMRDRAISILSVATTSVPEFASAVFLLAIFVYGGNLLPGTSSGALRVFDAQLVLPVAVLVIYNFGYYTRMIRASMAEVIGSQYVRTAILKGVPMRRVVLRHAMRNAMITPFTVMVLQINYLLSGVIVTEVVFAVDGFGRRLFEAAVYGDIYVIEACTLIAIATAVGTQFISDIGYSLLNPRIRFT
ncbi:MAG TPA: ABC transporter permease [Bradyrhizobium sp.]